MFILTFEIRLSIKVWILNDLFFLLLQKSIIDHLQKLGVELLPNLQLLSSSNPKSDWVPKLSFDFFLVLCYEKFLNTLEPIRELGREDIVPLPKEDFDAHHGILPPESIMNPILKLFQLVLRLRVYNFEEGHFKLECIIFFVTSRLNIWGKSYEFNSTFLFFFEFFFHIY